MELPSAKEHLELEQILKYYRSMFWLGATPMSLIDDLIAWKRGIEVKEIIKPNEKEDQA